MNENLRRVALIAIPVAGFVAAFAVFALYYAVLLSGLARQFTIELPF